MPDSGVPPSEFSWVEPAAAPPPGAGPEDHPGKWRWWLIATAVIVVVALAVGGVLAWRLVRNSRPVAEPLIGTPKNLLVSFPLNHQPVSGWRTTTTDLGLPPAVKIGDVFTSSADKVFLLTQDCGEDCGQAPTGHEAAPNSFVYGLNLRTGARLYSPVRLADFGGSTCHGNGPSVAVCLGFDHALKPTAYVVDLDRGAVIHSGSNDLKNPQEIGEQYGVTRLVDVVGDGYQVGPGTGVYGIGLHAEHTWFVPGRGSATVPGSSQVNDMPSLTLASQREGEGEPDRVFSVVDGKDLTPSTDKGRLDTAGVYQGGFAYQYTSGIGGGVLLYDESGRFVSSDGGDRYYLQNSAALPIFLDRKRDRWIVFSVDGSRLFDIPATDLVANFKTIGSTLFVQKPADLHNVEEQNPWQQWDLWTSKPAGPECHIDLGAGSYIGSDGQVIITKGDQSGQTIAVDRSTCKIIWQFPERTDVWKVATALLRSDFPYDAITSLRAGG